ncbi:hypothetical protein NM208_g659 [Fusarium decemcellulare]|uniref:Uncharacterized protein n=1 Tax=Fusarium decemcellulare TaxID=57161 RepID=A0ACC1SYU5_9HYPO|nr:hypothetical protein NM208_g659 [Fusarium decemcellulare]
MQCGPTAEEQARMQDPIMISVKTQPTEEQWLKHKPFIKTEYLVRDTSLQDLVVLLRSRGLHTKKAQLEYKLKTWGISKNIDKKAWQSIERKINKRKLEGKNSDVIYCGKRLKQSTINKATSRYRETNIFTQISQQHSPPPSPTNSQLVVCTPPPLTMDFEWPESLPWLRFCDGYLHGALDRLRPAAGTAPQPKPGTIRINPLLSTLASTLSQVQKTDPTTSISKLTSTIGRTMPEWYPGEHLETAQVLLTGPSDELMLDCLRIAIYQMANGMEVETFQDWVAFRDLLLDLGVLNLRIDPELRNHDIIIKAFMDNLFRNEILWLTSRNGTFAGQPLDLITWLLRSGQDPNCLLVKESPSSELGKIVTPLQSAIQVGYPELVELLLNFHAGLDATQVLCGGQPVMQLVHNFNIPRAVQSRMMRLLIPYCDSTNLYQAFVGAIKIQDIDLLPKLVLQDVDLTKTIKVTTQHHILCEETVLSLAIEAGGAIMNIVLDYVSSQHRPADYVTPDVFIAAAVKGDNDIIRRLHEMHPVGGSCNRRNIKPVHAAIKHGHLNTCRLFLQLYGGVLDSLVYVATGEGRESILRFLIREGADVNATMVWNDDAPQTTLERLSSIPGHIWHNRDLECAAILIDAGARPAGGEVLAFAGYHMDGSLKAALAAGGNPNEKDNCGRSVLQHLLATGYSSFRLDTVKTLLEAGATIHGGEVVTAIKLRSQDFDSTFFCIMEEVF